MKGRITPRALSWGLRGVIAEVLVVVAFIVISGLCALAVLAVT